MNSLTTQFSLLFHHYKVSYCRYQTPLLATLVSGVLAAVMALLFDLSQLVDMMSIGTLLAYTMVGVCVLLLRYRDTSMGASGPGYSPLSQQDLNDSEEELFPCNNTSSSVSCSRREYLRQCLNLDQVISPTPLSYLVTSHMVTLFTLLSIILTLSTHNTSLIIIISIIMIISLIIINRQPQDPNHPAFSVPLVPWLPATSVLINIVLMTKLSWQTWVR